MSMRAREVGRHSVLITDPSIEILVPATPGSTSDTRSGELGLKYGPSVCDGVEAPDSPHAGVGRAFGWADAPWTESMTTAAGNAISARRKARRARLRSPSPSIALLLMPA